MRRVLSAGRSAGGAVCVAARWCASRWCVRRMTRETDGPLLVKYTSLRVVHLPRVLGESNRRGVGARRFALGFSSGLRGAWPAPLRRRTMRSVAG